LVSSSPKDNMQKFIYFLPRALAVLITIFFAIFILEGFSPEFSWQDSLAHFGVALIMLLATIFAWKKPKIGGWFFILAGIYFIKGLFVAIPLLLSGILFLAEGFGKKIKR
jgi:hypothetical protein